MYDVQPQKVNLRISLLNNLRIIDLFCLDTHKVGDLRTNQNYIQIRVPINRNPISLVKLNYRNKHAMEKAV